MLTAERGAAAEEVLKRCRGFERMSERELNETGIALRGKLKQLGSIEASMDELDSPPIVDRATLNALLETHTASAFELAQQTLARMLREEIKVPADSDEARQIEVAVMLAACDMGKDCSASSYASLYQCAYYGNCQPVGHDWREGLSEPDINHVMELKKRVVERVNNRGFK